MILPQDSRYNKEGCGGAVHQNRMGVVTPWERFDPKGVALGKYDAILCSPGAGPPRKASPAANLYGG